MKRIPSVVVLLFTTLYFLFFLPKTVSAVSITIQNPPSSITTDPFTLSVSITGPSAGVNYLRIDIYKDATSDYFGSTDNGSEFYNGSEFAKYFSITIDSSKSWSGNIRGKIDTGAKEYKGPGSYKIRLRRYTASGNYDSQDANASAVSVTINAPTLTPTPMPTQPPTDTPKPTATPKPTVTQKLTPTTKASASQVNTSTPTQLITRTVPTKSLAILTTISQATSESGEVLGDNAMGNTSPTPSPDLALSQTATVLGESQDNKWAYAFLAIFIGSIFFSGIIYMQWKKHKIKKTQQNM